MHSPLQIGDKVKVLPNVAGGDYIGEIGHVCGFSKNMFDQPLVEIKRNQHERKLSFYPHELMLLQTPASR